MFTRLDMKTFLSLCGGVLFVVAALLAMIWVQVTSDIGGRDVAFAAVSAAPIWSAGFLLRRAGAWRQASFRVIPRFAINWCVFVVLFSVPLLDGWLLHPAAKRGHPPLWWLGFSIWMASFFTFMDWLRHDPPQLC